MGKLKWDLGPYFPCPFCQPPVVYDPAMRWVADKSQNLLFCTACMKWTDGPPTGRKSIHAMRMWLTTRRLEALW